FPWLSWHPELAAGDPAGLTTDIGLLAFVLTITAVFTTAGLVLAARLRRWPATEYLGLIAPDGRKTAIAVGMLAAILALAELVTWLLGYDAITPFQRELSQQAKAAGSLTLLWYTLVVVAPVGEEMMFRGFLHRGWVRSARSAVPAIMIISALW